MLKRVMILAALTLVVGLLLFAGGAVVLAQGPNPNPAQTPQPGSNGRGPMMNPGYGQFGGGRGMMGGQSLVDVAATVLNMNRADVVAGLQGGKSLAQIAGNATKTQAIVDAFVATRSAWLQQMVASGRLTQDQANQMLATMRTHVQEQVNEPGLAGRGPHEDCPMYQNGAGTGTGTGTPGRRGGGMRGGWGA